MDLKNALTAALNHKELFSENGICETFVEFDISAMPEKPFIIISGDNASGKSFFCSALQTFLAKNDGDKGGKFLGMNFSMNRRTSPNISRAFIYGDEANQSTGEISIHSILGAINNSRKYDENHIIIFDEPDIGLSEAFIPALGQYIAQYYEDLPKAAGGIILVTHSRLLTKELMKINPMTIRIGSQQNTLDWIQNGSPVKTIDDLLNINKTSHERFGKIEHYLRKRREEKRAETQPSYK